MTAGYLSVPVMRLNHCWTVLHMSILAALLFAVNAEGEDPDCYIEARVPRGIVYEVFSGEDLRINCTVVLCSDSPPTVVWYKDGEKSFPVNVNSSSHIRTEWRRSNDREGFLYLIFQKILLSDSGAYQCKIGDDLSHSIMVNVSESGESEQPHSTTTSNHQTSSTNSNADSKDNFWMYIYAAAGILAFVILVIIISFASMQGCKGKSKTRTQTENQYMAIPMVEQPFPHASHQASPRGSPSVPPPRRSTRRGRPPSKPIEMPLQRDNEELPGQIKEDRGRQRNVQEEEVGSLVYAALNHQVPAVAAARPLRPQEECSEYAVIRVKEL